MTNSRASFWRKKHVEEAHRLREEEGLQNGEIAQRLGVSPHTVQDYFRTQQQKTRINARRISNQIIGLFIDQGKTTQEIADELHVSMDLVQVCIQSYPYLMGASADKEESLVELRKEISILKENIAQLQEAVQRQRNMIWELRKTGSGNFLQVSKELDERLKNARRKYIDGEAETKTTGPRLSDRRGQRVPRRTYRPIT